MCAAYAADYGPTTHVRLLRCKTTGATRSAKLTLSGSAGDHVNVTITHPGYRSLR